MARVKKVKIKPKKKGQKPITFKQGGMHKTLGIKKGNKISAKTHQKAASGKLGKKAKKQELFRRNVLKGKKKGR